MTLQYPESYAAISSWALWNNVPPSVARRRFAQYAVLHAIASSRLLNTILVFKGGNALDFVWQPNRSTIDLDFSADMKQTTSAFDELVLGQLLRRSLDASGRVLGVTFVVHSVKRQPPGEGKTFISFAASIGYALEDDTGNRRRIEQSKPSKAVIPVEISMNEPICADILVEIDGVRQLRVCTIEDIVAEKLRALLQQPLRNRNRRQDLLDIAVALRSGPHLDHARVADFLLEKANARDVRVSRAAFHRPEISAYAHEGYQQLQANTRVLFIPFEEALALVYAFIDTLPIPLNDY